MTVDVPFRMAEFISFYGSRPEVPFRIDIPEDLVG